MYRIAKNILQNIICNSFLLTVYRFRVLATMSPDFNDGVALDSGQANPSGVTGS